jgi:hypothetical protein
MRKLSDSEREVVYEATCKAWAQSGHRRLATARLVRAHLVSSGWEVILIELAIKYLIPIILEWARKRFSPPSEMPSNFLDGVE